MAGNRVTAAQQDLVTANMDLVRSIAKRAARILPVSVEMDDICANGYVGLCQAAERYKPELHPNFRVYAIKRIRGAIQDAYEGPRYPRRYTEMPEAWLGEWLHSAHEDHRSEPIPEMLIDRSSPLEELVEQEQSVVVCIEAYRATRALDAQQKTIVSASIGGQKVVSIARRQGKSEDWVGHRLRQAKRTMRERLEKDRRKKELEAERNRRLAKLREEIRLAFREQEDLAA